MRVHKSILKLSFAHFFIDAYAGMLGVFLPFLRESLNLTLTEAGILGGALVFSSSLMQPVYGYLADRLRHKAFAALGPAISGIFICSLGMAPNFYALLVLVILGGVGIAAFHPQGAAVTREFSDKRPGYEMSVFITGGMIGYGVGPIYITSVIALAGLEQSYWAAVPGVLVSIYLLLCGPAPSKEMEPIHHTHLKEQIREMIRPLSVHYFLVVIRSLNQMVFVAFLPLYFTVQGLTAAEGAQHLSLFLLTGGVTGLCGGFLADRFGGKIICSISMIGYFPMALAFLLTTGPLSTLMCALAGGFLLFANPVNVVMAQRLIPTAAGTVAALMMGFAWGISGFVIPLIGAFGDIFGLHTVLVWFVALTSPGFLLAFWLPSHRAEALTIGSLQYSRGE
jgi:FSR family fosmidomycin resistance protein-like MFS transporter